MSKQGRQRRTPEQRLAAREARSTIGYIRRIQREVQQEEFDKMIADIEAEVSETEVSVTDTQ